MTKPNTRSQPIRQCKNCHRRFTTMIEGAGYKYCSKACAQQGKNQWYKRNKQRKRLYYLEYRYGIKHREFLRLMDQQEGKCAICEKPITFGGGRRKVNMDHDHDTGQLRGLLCARCNHGLAFFDDNIENLLSAVYYLQRGIC